MDDQNQSTDAADQRGPPEYWSRPADALMAELATTDAGLPADEVVRRLRRFGHNSFEPRRRYGALRLLLSQFESPLVLILLFGVVISAVVRDWVDAGIVLLIVLGSTGLGFIQEFHASTAIERLRRRIGLKVSVLRDGTPELVPADEIVPGDVVRLSAGNLVPADGAVIRARDFLVTEAVLTGESFPVEKQAGVSPREAPLAARTNCVFLGTSVRSGTADVLIVQTGAATEYGGIADRLSRRAPETEFARGIRHFGYLLTQVMAVIVVLVFAANLGLHRPLVESLLFAVALAVGLSPELLPAIVSVTLSAGARAMARRGVIVRRLQAIENLGSIDVLCTDKTGTLTEGVVELDAALDADGRTADEALRLAFVNAALQTGIENPLDAAIVASGAKAGLSAGSWHKVDEIPYDFVRRRLTVVTVEDAAAGTHCIVTKGALSNVLDICASVLKDGAEQPLDDAARLRIASLFEQKGRDGFRVLGLATKLVPAQADYDLQDEQGMAFAGFLLFLDPPKPEIASTLADLSRLGVGLKIITGDNRFVSAHVAEAIGMRHEAMLTGEQLNGLRDEALWHLAERTKLFVEVDPHQKERIIRALQKTGHAVGYLGDGINDAPALHAADVGISVDKAVDVARESADIVLLEHDLDVLRSGIEDGRRTFANTLKYIAITTSANFGNMVSMAIASIFLPFLPLLAKQILLNNFLSDFPSIAIAGDNVDRELVDRPHRWNMREIKSFMILFGLVSSLFDFLTFGLLLYVFGAGETVFQTGWFVESLMTELAVVLVLRTHKPFHRSRPGRLLLWSTLAVAAVAILLPYSGPLAQLFGFVPLPIHLLLLLLAMTALYVLATETVKARIFRGGR